MVYREKGQKRSSPQSGGVRQLPTVIIDGRPFFVDAVLGEFRACDNPHVWLTFQQFDDDYIEQEDGSFKKLVQP